MGGGCAGKFHAGRVVIQLIQLPSMDRSAGGDSRGGSKASLVISWTENHPEPTIERLSVSLLHDGMPSACLSGG